jgi:rhodanese-related sulfurtransferase
MAAAAARNGAAMDDVRIDRTRAHALVASGARLIDVRTPEEFAGGAAPGAVNLPVQVSGNVIGDHCRADETVVLYCRSGARSDSAARLLRQMGYANSFNAGGLGDIL